MHELPAGEALHAWIVLQQLMPAIRDDLAHHRLPRSTRAAPRDARLDQYWKIERTPVEPAVESPPPPEEPADDIAGAFLLSKIVLASPKAEIAAGDVPLITTATDPYAYAAAVPIEASAVAGLTGRGWVRVRLRVNAGRISVGVLNKRAQKFLAQASLDRTQDVQEVQLTIEDLSDVGTLMISNNRPGETARSVAELHSVELKRFRH